MNDLYELVFCGDKCACPETDNLLAVVATVSLMGLRTWTRSSQSTVICELPKSLINSD